MLRRVNDSFRSSEEAPPGVIGDAAEPDAAAELGRCSGEQME